MYQQGDIIWVKYPFSDKPDKHKVRPAIVISNSKSNQLDNDLLICPITSQIRNTPFSLVIENKDLTVRLPLKCEIRCNKIYTVRNVLIIGKLSYLKEKYQNELLRKVISCFTK